MSAGPSTGDDTWLNDSMGLMMVLELRLGLRGACIGLNPYQWSIEA